MRLARQQRLVLVISDAATASKLAPVMRFDDVEVVSEGSVERARRHLGRAWRRPDIIIAGSAEVAERLAELDGFEWDIPIVVTTGRNDAMASARAVRVGAAACLDRALDARALRSALHLLLERRSLARVVWRA
jgi:DNA-binding NtrC family response regulator